MSPITALVKSDFIKLLGLRRSMIPFVIVMICFSLSPQFLSAGMIMLIYGSVFTMLAYDQSSSSWHWYGSLPVTRRQIFLGKYCFSLLLLLASIPFMTVSYTHLIVLSGETIRRVSTRRKSRFLPGNSSAAKA